MTEKYHLKIKWKDYKKTEAIEIVLFDDGQPLAEFKSIEDARLVRDILNDQEEFINIIEEDNINLQIKLQKIRDYAEEDGEVKQGVIEKVVMYE